MESTAPKCPKCGLNNAVVPIIYGYPDQDMLQSLELWYFN